MLPIEIDIELEVPSGFDNNHSSKDLSDDDNVTFQLLDQELDEHEARKQQEEAIIKGLMEANAGYPGS